MIPFDDKCRGAWRLHLQSDPGVLGLAHLREHSRPAIRDDALPHEMQLDLGKQLGFEIALKAVEALGNLAPEPPQVTTPTLRSVRR